MKPVNFAYARPRDVEAALSLLAEDGRSVKVLAGSQSLGPMLNMRLVQPDLLVDITGVEELRQVKEEADGVVIGACVTHSDIEDRRVPDVTGGALPSVAQDIAYRAVRNRGTIGGQPHPRRSVGGLDLDSRSARRLRDFARPDTARARSPSRITCSARSRRISGRANCSSQ